MVEPTKTGVEMPQVAVPQAISATVERRSLPLKAPYALSFTTLDSFEAVLLHLHLDNGEVWWGEVVPLPGYASETVEDVLSTVEAWLSKLPEQPVQQLRQHVAHHIAATPFASSLILSAIDAGILHHQLPADRICVPLVYPTASTKPNLEQAVEQAIQAGYRTIKVKIGESLAQDLEALPKLQRSLSAGVQVRFDANQGYTLAEARSFLQAVETHLAGATQLVEQPLPPAAWEEMAQLSSHTAIPLMLDESIYTVADVDRAAEVGCQWIKLKLCKQGGTAELLQIAKYAKQLGLRVVIGNGVATDISNLLELKLHHCYADLFDGASESNGFVKLQQAVLYPALELASGCAVWQEAGR